LQHFIYETDTRLRLKPGISISEADILVTDK